MRELLTRSRRKFFGYLILATLLMKMVAPALSHAWVVQPISQGQWLVAICTATGLKYISARTNPIESPISGDETFAHGSSTDHCLLCSSGAQDGLPTDSCWDSALALSTRTVGLAEYGSRLQQKVRWPPAYPRGPPLA